MTHQEADNPSRLARQSVAPIVADWRRCRGLMLTALTSSATCAECWVLPLLRALALLLLRTTAQAQQLLMLNRPSSRPCRRGHSRKPSREPFRRTLFDSFGRPTLFYGIRYTSTLYGKIIPGTGRTSTVIIILVQLYCAFPIQYIHCFYIYTGHTSVHVPVPVLLDVSDELRTVGHWHGRPTNRG